MLHSDAYRVEEHQHYDEPVKPLGLHSVPNPETKPLFRSPEVRTLAHRTSFALQETYEQISVIMLVLEIFDLAIVHSLRGR